MDFESKKLIRKHILEIRDRQNLEDRARWDDAIFLKFIGSEYYKNAGVIFIFVSFRSEVDTRRVIKKALEDGKTVCVPRVISKDAGMKAFRINNIEELKPGYYGVLEPSPECEEVPEDEIDLVVMPGAAFDRKGGRIGYGGGFYDKFLPGLRHDAKKIALAYDFQVLEHVPTDEHDIKADGIITN